MNIVWFKRDLRLSDHAPLKAALQENEALLMLYIWEPSVMADPHYDPRHWRFVQQSLLDLNEQFRAADSLVSVNILEGEAVDIFAFIHQKYGIKNVFSYQETGLQVTYNRDKALAKWFKNQGIGWKEFQTNGIVRGLKNRDDWAKKWHDVMYAPQDTPNWGGFKAEHIVFGPQNPIFDFFAPRKSAFQDPVLEKKPKMQPGGESYAQQYLKSFLSDRAANYSKFISKPLESRRSCSRLSPFLAWGNLSMRQVFQASINAQKVVPFKRQLDNFGSRLRWHCHFIQKFEMESRMEFENVNRGFDDLKRIENQDFIEKWKTGQTGYPLVDACMRCVCQTGYLNFRMRAMLVSFLTLQLFQHWKEGAVHLAKQFLDFEPGIHYPQFQMQAGVTGTNTVRMYNPVKQSYEHDPDGVFIKTWVKELENCPVGFIHEPWKMTPMEQDFYQFWVGKDYPLPVVDLQGSLGEAKKKIWEIRNSPAVKAENERILKTHVVKKRNQKAQ